MKRPLLLSLRWFAPFWLCPLFLVLWVHASGSPLLFLFVLAPYFFVSGFLAVAPLRRRAMAFGQWFLYACVVPFVVALVAGIAVGVAKSCCP